MQNLCKGSFYNLPGFEKQRTGNVQIAYHDECAILSRAAAELISLESSWSLQISELNDVVCQASADEFERHLDFQMKQSNEYTSVATDIHQKLIAQEKNRKEVNADESKDKDQIFQQREEGKRKRRHVSALLAASMGRSAMDHMRSHVTRDVDGTSGLINTGTVITYKED